MFFSGFGDFPFWIVFTGVLSHELEVFTGQFILFCDLESEGKERLGERFGFFFVCFSLSVLFFHAFCSLSWGLAGLPGMAKMSLYPSPSQLPEMSNSQQGSWPSSPCHLPRARPCSSWQTSIPEDPCRRRSWEHLFPPSLIPPRFLQLRYNWGQS